MYEPPRFSIHGYNIMCAISWMIPITQYTKSTTTTHQTVFEKQTRDFQIGK